MAGCHYNGGVKSKEPDGVRIIVEYPFSSDTIQVRYGIPVNGDTLHNSRQNAVYGAFDFYAHGDAPRQRYHIEHANYRGEIVRVDTVIINRRSFIR